FLGVMLRPVFGRRISLFSCPHLERCISRRMCTCEKRPGGWRCLTAHHFPYFHWVFGYIMLGQAATQTSSRARSRGQRCYRSGGEAVGKRYLGFALVFGLLLGLCFSASGQDAKSVLQSASKAMGDVKSIQYSGTGQFGILGQA